MILDIERVILNNMEELEIMENKCVLKRLVGILLAEIFNFL